MSSADDFFKGLVFGVALGATAGILLAPKSGAETREDLKKLAEDLGDKATDLYKDARKEVNKKIAELKKAGQKIDYEEYKRLVGKVVDEVKKDGKVTAQVAKQIGEQLGEDWAYIRDTMVD